MCFKGTQILTCQVLEVFLANAVCIDICSLYKCSCMIIETDIEGQKELIFGLEGIFKLGFDIQVC